MPFSLRYVAHELRRRFGRTVLTALGLAVGVGLVVAIIGVSTGLTNAQNQVLTPLESVGTDILVTRVAGNQEQNGSATSNPQTQQPAPGQGGPGGFLAPGNPLNQEDTVAVLNDNANLVTDLSKLGKPGEKFTRDFFLPATLLTFPQESLDEVSKLKGVSSAVGALSLLATHQTGTVPQIVAEIQTGGETLTQTVAPEPMTEAEREAARACVERQGGGPPPGGEQPAPPPEGGQGGPQQGVRGRFEDCLPERFRQFRASFVTPLRTLRQVLNPPSTDITATNYTAAGVDTAHANQGVITEDQITEGRFFSKGTKDEVILNVAYANKNDLKVGSDLAINGTTFHVVGLSNPALAGNTSDVYFSLESLQTLSDKSGRVNIVLVKATDSESVAAVAKEISKALPGAQVVTTRELADQATGSLADAKKLVDRFGTALALIVLIGAFVIAILLTLSAVAKRIREIGTLRAIGWSKSMVVRQVLLETLGIGILGGLLGAGVGIGAGYAVSRFSPELSATSAGVPNAASSSLARLFGLSSEAVSKTIHLNVPIEPATLAMGIGFALIGGILAGMIGGWRASRLQPAVALRDIG